MPITNLVSAVRNSVAAQNWYSALSMAISFPDICGKIDDPALGSQARYTPWFKTYVEPKYLSAMSTHVYLSGRDCYALRCAYLHQGEFGTNDQRARDALNRFVFLAPPSGTTMHKIQCDSILFIQIDVFCNDLCDAVEQWLGDIRNDPDKTSKAYNLARIALPGEEVVINPDKSVEFRAPGVKGQPVLMAVKIPL
jgi:hypothetical protein